MPKRVLLTGPQGLLGRHMLALLERERIDVVPLGRADWDLRQPITSQNLDTLAGSVDAILHFGALTPMPGEAPALPDLLDANVRSCAILGEWAIQHGIPLLYASSAGIYAPSSAPVDEDAPEAVCPWGGHYGLSKLLGERLLRGLTATGLRLCVLRIGSLYGTGMSSGKLVAKWLQIAEQGGSIDVLPPTDDAVNFVHALDVAQAALSALRAEAWSCFNIVGRELVTMDQLAHACVRVAGRGRVRSQEEKPSRPGNRLFNASTARAAAAFGYTSRLSLVEGLELMRGQVYEP